VNLPVTAVLMGGPSREREVSLLSGRNVAEALLEGGVPRVVAVEILPGGGWRVGEEGVLSPLEALVRLLEIGTGCFFLALHGPGGEDGSVQGLLEILGVPYTGSGVSASALAMSKTACRAVLGAAGIPLPPGAELRRPDSEAIRRAAFKCGFPCFLKEDASGSSLGVHRVAGPEDLDRVLEGLEGLEGKGEPLVVESAVSGTEATVAVLGNRDGELEALPVVEILPRKAFFDYQAKYDPAWTEEVCPPGSLSPALQETLRELAVRVHRVLGCDGVSRTDFIVGPDGPVVLECNTIPGLTRESLLPKAAGAAGISFPELTVRMVRLALELHGR